MVPTTKESVISRQRTRFIEIVLSNKTWLVRGILVPTSRTGKSNRKSSAHVLQKTVVSQTGWRLAFSLNGKLRELLPF